jgi:hypothetical protein
LLTLSYYPFKDLAVQQPSEATRLPLHDNENGAFLVFLHHILEDEQFSQEIFGDETDLNKQAVLASSKWLLMTDAEQEVSGFLYPLDHENDLLIRKYSLLLHEPSEMRRNTN